MALLMGDPRSRARHESAKQSTSEAGTATRSFVTFALGTSRFALDSSLVKEVVMPARVYPFPHTMPSLEGVLVRRGMAIPVCDVARAFGPGGPRSLYVIAQCSYAGSSHAVAIPVSGACELVQGQRWEETEEASPFAITFVSGLLRTGSGTVPLLDMDQVVSHCIQALSGTGKEAGQ
jgi:chemotaxis signal transduction protein